MRRLFVLLIAALAVTALVAGAAYAGGKPKNVKKAKADIEEAYDCFLSGALGYTVEQKGECVEDVADDPDLLALATQTEQQNAGSAAITEPVVNKINFTSAKKADVDFDLEVGGELLADIAPPGEAVLVKDGGKKVWKVSVVTFCNLTALGNPTVASEGACAEIIASG
jgi:hypothetical protein